MENPFELIMERLDRIEKAISDLEKKKIHLKQSQKQ